MRQSTTQNLVFTLLLAAVSCFLFWKCPYGYGNIDEAFYLTIPYRLSLGDALFEEEWHLSQMAGFLTVPFVSAYTSIKGNTNGIILAMRYFCTFLQCLVSIFLYVRLRKISWAGSVIASVSFVLYIPFGIMALSYNSMAIWALLISLVLAMTAERRKPLQYAISGICFAAAVLCCPFLMLAYFLYLVAVAISALKHQKPFSQDNTFFQPQGAAWFSLGAALTAFVFAAYVVYRGSLYNILRSFQHILEDDPEHPSISLVHKINQYYTNILFANSWTPPLYSIYLVIAAVQILDRKRRNHRPVYTLLLTTCTLALLYSCYHFNHYINHLMWPVNILALFLFFLSDSKNIRSLFFYIWIPGILYTFCLHLCSNQNYYAISSASAVSTVGSLIIITLYIKELTEHNPKAFHTYMCNGMLFLMLAAQILSQGILRYQSVFWEIGGMDCLTRKIGDGINAGIYTSEKKYASYYDSLDALSVLDSYDGQSVLYLSKNTWYYLVGNHPMATFSAWSSGVNEITIDRLYAYYDINPEKLPDVVFSEEEYKNIAELFCDIFCYHLQEIPGGFLLTPQ